MKHSGPSDVSSGVEPPPTAIPELDATSVYGRVGIEAFVMSAYDAHHGEIFAFLARATRDPSVAEELLQVTFRRLTQEARSGRTPIEVRPWLYRVASNLLINGAGGQTTARNVVSSQVAGTPRREPAGEIELALEGLSADARIALLLSGEGFAGEEIADAIGRSAAATRTLLCRARARVRVRRELFAEQAP